MKKGLSVDGIGIRVQKTPGKGRGVIALRNFKKGDIIERAPVIVLSEKDKKLIEKTELFNHYFDWGRGSKKAAISLGWGSIYNHSWQPNAEYIHEEKNETLVFRAIRPIKKGEEICTTYNGDVKDISPYFFRRKGKLVQPK